MRRIGYRCLSASATVLRSVLIQLFASLQPKLFGGTYSVSKVLEVRLNHRCCSFCEFRRPTRVQVECRILDNRQSFLFLTGNGGWTTLECLLCYRNDFAGMYSVWEAAFLTQRHLFCGWTGPCLGHNLCTGPTFAAP